MIKRVICAALVMLMLPSASADTLAELQKCAAMQDSLVRLVCYDKVMKSLDSAQSSSTLPTPVRATEPSDAPSKAPQRPTVAQPKVVLAPAAAESAFGEEHLDSKVKEKQAKELQQVVFTIKSIKKNNLGKRLVTFENDQIWKQSDGQYLKLSAGDRVELSKGAFGVIYLKRIDANKKIKVKRVK